MAKSKHFSTGSTVRHTGKFLKSIGMHKGAPVDGLVLGTMANGQRVLVAWSDGHTSMVNPANLEKTRNQPNYDTKALVTAQRVLAREKLDPTMWTQSEIQEIIDGFERDDLSREEAIAAEWAEKNRPEVVRRYRTYLTKVAPLQANPSATAQFFQSQLDAEQERLLDSLVLIAENDGDAYRHGKNVKKAVDDAFKEITRLDAAALRENYPFVREKAISIVKQRWGVGSKRGNPSFSEAELIARLAYNPD